MSYENILLPVAGTRHHERAGKALEHALRLSPKHITVVHAIEPLSKIVGGEAHAELLREATANALTNLSPLLNVIENAGVSHTVRVIEGTPADTIIKASHENPCDIIVMFTDGRDGLEDMLIGSTTERVLRNTDLPLLTVRK
ncbi:MAG: universal stress protein [Desulfovibrionaceae bacterium]